MSDYIDYLLFAKNPFSHVNQIKYYANYTYITYCIVVIKCLVLYLNDFLLKILHSIPCAVTVYMYLETGKDGVGGEYVPSVPSHVVPGLLFHGRLLCRVFQQRLAVVQMQIKTIYVTFHINIIT